MRVFRACVDLEIGFVAINDLARAMLGEQVCAVAREFKGRVGTENLLASTEAVNLHVTLAWHQTSFQIRFGFHIRNLLWQIELEHNRTRYDKSDYIAVRFNIQYDK
jgi:hypothetical protein